MGLLVVAVVAVAVVAYGLVGRDDEPAATPREPSPTTPAATAAPAPAVGSCYALTAGALQTAHDASPTVPCTADHTARTFVVETLTDDDLGDPEAVDTELLARRADERCRAALPAEVGAETRTLALSRLRSAWFVPTEDDLALGARWLRCDVVALRDESTLAQLPDDTADMLATEDRLERWRTCAQASLAQLQAGQGQRMCALEHDWRTVGTRRVGDASDPWPGDAAARGRVLERCEGQVRAYVDDPLATVTVGWLPPTEAQWAEGARFGLCWARTT